MRMQSLFTPEGEAALAAVLRLRPLMAFDFDGTLAPIVARPDDARVSVAVTSRLEALTARLPVAIVTGRTIADVRGRLGFEPQFIVGNHGAEEAQSHGTQAQRLSEPLDRLRALLNAREADLRAAGIGVEDKGLSIALHYRLSRDRGHAEQLLAALLNPTPEGLRLFAGKMVVNAVAADAPDKADAVRALVSRVNAAAAFFAGDDVNDEPVFESAPPHWLTLRVGRDDPGSRARFCLEGPQQMALVLERVLTQLA
ncbi:trehalose-phosphatase [Pelomonas cellulosilytica]|uniref:Trehalose 6-phosphate phosphatase n=1 Tax=Pelomonas cellulosilytica TaxID=2906762 RepID=A0ABS8XSH8_9BURK|nr:trehalose-phosphatase [Pelomonas sp. P8]MCE4554133.1 trehalose-phosphatase [Pelomonas sp. P8]